MPFTGNQYVPPNGATNAAPGQVVFSAVWDAIFTDLAAALTQLATQANTTPTWANIMAANGGFSIWQRGAGSAASFAVPASTTQYTADRWYVITGVNQASVVAAATVNSVAQGAKITRNAAQTGITAMTFGYPLTLDEVGRLRGQQVSFSGAATAGANWSPTTGTFAINLYVGTGAAGKRGGGFAGETNPLSISTNLAPSTANTAITGTSSGTVAATSTQGELQITWTPTGTAGADDSITFGQFCLVSGAIVQTFTNIPFDESLRQCKRFYRKSFNYGVAPASGAGFTGALEVVAAAASKIGIYVNFEPVEMYATAAFTTFNPQIGGSNWYDGTTTATVAASFDVLGPTASPKGLFIIGATVAAANDLLFIHYVADAGL